MLNLMRFCVDRQNWQCKKLSPSISCDSFLRGFSRVIELPNHIFLREVNGQVCYIATYVDTNHPRLRSHPLLLFFCEKMGMSAHPHTTQWICISPVWWVGPQESTHRRFALEYDEATREIVCSVDHTYPPLRFSLNRAIAPRSASSAFA